MDAGTRHVRFAAGLPAAIVRNSNLPALSRVHIPGAHPQMIQVPAVPAAMLIPFPYEVTASASISNAQIPHSFLNPFIFAFYFVKGLQFLLNMKLQLIRFPGW